MELLGLLEYKGRLDHLVREDFTAVEEQQDHKDKKE
jgi:hypothetical protein